MTEMFDGGAFSSQVLGANLDVLHVLAPALAQTLMQCPPAREDVQVEILESGYPIARARLRNRMVPLYLTENPNTEMQQWVQSLSLDSQGGKGCNWVLVGCGLGYELKALIQRLPPTGVLWVYEPDPMMMLLALSRLNCAEPLIEGRLRLAVGMNLEPLLEGISSGSGSRTTPHVLIPPQQEPLLCWEATSMVRALERVTGGIVYTNVTLTRPLPTLDTDSTPKPTGPVIEVNAPQDRPLRICLAQGGLFFEDMAYAFTQRGDELHILHTDRMVIDEMVHALRQVKADLVVSIDLINGMGEICAEVGIPYLIWEINPRVWVPGRPTSAAAQATYIFTYRQRNVRWYQEMGYTHVEHLVLATTPEWRRPMDISPGDREKYRAATSFVGNSMLHDDQADFHLAQNTLKRLATESQPLEQRRWLAALNVIKEAVELQSRDLLYPIVVERLETGFARLGLSCELPVQHKPGEEVLDLRIIYSRLFGTQRRKKALETLSPFGMAVYGDRGWERLPMSGVYYRGPAEHGTELTTIYNVTHINLDVGRLYQLDIVTMRVFDILAAGGFALVEYSQELPLVLEPGREVIAWRDWTELREAAEYYLQNPRERQDVIDRGRERVLREHTIVGRVQYMIARLKEQGVFQSASTSAAVSNAAFPHRES